MMNHKDTLQSTDTNCEFDKDSNITISIVITSELKPKKKIFEVYNTDEYGLLYGWSETANDYTLRTNEFCDLLKRFIELNEVLSDS